MQAAQLVHAAGESSPGNLAEGTHVVVLTALGEAELAKVADRLHAAGIEFVAVREPDPPWGGQLMAIGVRPMLRREVRRHLSSLPLLK